MTLQQAMSVQPELVALDADEPYYRGVFERLLVALGRVSDMVEDGGLGEAYVRLDGIERMRRGEAGAALALLNAVPDYLNPRVGVADSRFGAYVAARTAAPMRAARAPEDAAAFLAPLSIGLLPVPAEMKFDLYRFGMRTMGDVASTGGSAMFDRFGQEGLTAWELCKGVERRPFVPRKIEETVSERTSLPFSTTSMETLRVALDLLLARAFARPALRNRSAGSATVESSASESATWKLQVRFKVPVERWERASELLGERVDERIRRSYPLDDLSLTLSDLGGEPGVQTGLLRDAREDSRETLIGVDRRLRGLMDGLPALRRAVEVAPWHPAPEMRSLLVPIDPLASDGVRALRAPAPAEVREADERGPAAIRLRGRWRDIERVSDRWTFDLWWLPKPMSRRYYRVESTDGFQTTLFRDGISGLWYRQPG